VEDARGNRLLAVVNLEVREAAHGEIGVREDDGDNGGPKPGWRRGRRGGGSTRSSARAGCRVVDGGALSLSQIRRAWNLAASTTGVGRDLAASTTSQNRATSHYGAVTGLQTTKHGMYLLSSGMRT